jgi:hypothetical protein
MTSGMFLNEELFLSSIITIPRFIFLRIRCHNNMGRIKKRGGGVWWNKIIHPIHVLITYDWSLHAVRAHGQQMSLVAFRWRTMRIRNTQHRHASIGVFYYPLLGENETVHFSDSSVSCCVISTDFRKFTWLASVRFQKVSCCKSH